MTYYIGYDAVTRSCDVINIVTTCHKTLHQPFLHPFFSLPHLFFISLSSNISCRLQSTGILSFVDFKQLDTLSRLHISLASHLSARQLVLAWHLISASHFTSVVSLSQLDIPSWLDILTLCLLSSRDRNSYKEEKQLLVLGEKIQPKI
jgi:hypothetical protein